MNKTKIEMFSNGFEWNPLRVQCMRDCKNPIGESICWTRRFKKWIPERPVWDEKELKVPLSRKVPADILVCWMTDLMFMGTNKQIQAIIDVCVTMWALGRPIRFFFLTKSPERYQQFKFPENCWLGTSVADKNSPLFWQPWRNKIFLSLEPLYGDVSREVLVSSGNFEACIPDKAYDWVFIGPETRGNAHCANLKVLPKKKWLLNIREICKKNNILFWEKNVLGKVGLLDQLIQQKPF